jgi:DNA-binding protein H-NS
MDLPINKTENELIQKYKQQQRDYDKIRYLKNKTKLKEKYITNKTVMREKQKQYYNNNKNKYKQYYANNVETIKDNNRKYKLLKKTQLQVS